MFNTGIDARRRVLDERTRRLVAAAEAEVIGFGGVSAVARASGLSRGTVIRGMAELKVSPRPVRRQRIRRQGAVRGQGTGTQLLSAIWNLWWSR